MRLSDVGLISHNLDTFLERQYDDPMINDEDKARSLNTIAKQTYSLALQTNVVGEMPLLVINCQYTNILRFPSCMVLEVGRRSLNLLSKV